MCVYVELCVGGAAVSSDGYGYNEKEEEEEELKQERKRERRRGRLKETKAKREIQPDREVVSVYQEHTDLAASSLSVVVPSSSLLQHLPERHQAEQDPNPSTAPSQDHSLINLVLLQAQLSSSALPTPYLFVFTPSHKLFFMNYYPLEWNRYRQASTYENTNTTARSEDPRKILEKVHAFPGPPQEPMTFNIMPDLFLSPFTTLTQSSLPPSPFGSHYPATAILLQPYPHLKPFLFPCWGW
ncbi:hypothetical protein Q5P01_003951 [Channa striata]|uniref:Uncharacterized protein n=1 Tax=Channa striata TaxID=64152 RepID=A0AA88NKJ4_CHASR|nr:hypothetical protein Q5P01_003951 [Channa striata]